MSSFYTKNLCHFEQRFPALYEQHRRQCNHFTPDDIAALSVQPAKSGVLTARNESVFLHSAYDPLREAKKNIQENDCIARPAVVFFSAGLGYVVQEFARTYPEKTIVLLEPNLCWFLAALWYTDWTSVFSLRNLVLLLDAPTDTAAQFIENLGSGEYTLIYNANQGAHAHDYFDRVLAVLDYHRQKEDINERTQEKFSRLWVKNTFRNCIKALECPGIIQYKAAASGGVNVPVCIIAAGPSLDEILPYLERLKKRTVLVCVDTALRACLLAGVQPHFIVLSDAQYWNYRHLDGLSSPQSILITELAAYPPVFRFTCKKICLFSSLYPPGKFIERFTEKKGELGAGGSVATTAWDFARLLGATDIFIAGLDLGFPAKKTHFKGSTFEERAHLFSNRLHPAETDSYLALYSAAPFYAADNNGNPLLTDKRMTLYAWWFENACARYTDQKTHSLTPQGIAIPGIIPAHIDYILALPERENELGSLCEAGKAQCVKTQKTELCQALFSASKALDQLDSYAQKALKLCAEGETLLKHSTNTVSEKADSSQVIGIIQELTAIDTQLASNPAYDLAALVFTGGTKKAFQDKLDTPHSHTDALNTFIQSKHIYSRLQDAVLICRPELKKAQNQLNQI